MSVKVAKSRFIVFSFAGFYQQAIKKHWDFQKLGDYLVQTAEAAQDLRQSEAVRECSLVLSNLPLKEYQLWGSYYQAWYEYRNSKESQTLLEKVVEQSDSCRSKSLLILAALAGEKKDFTSEGRYLSEALYYARDLATIANVSRAIAILKSKEGYSKLALKDLERTLPLVRYTRPRAYYDYLNSYAVELGEVGRIEEAENVCRITLASPFINAYPEWRETGAEIARRGYSSRSSVSVQIEKIQAQNVLCLPERPATPVSSESTLPARLLSFVDWKNKMVKEPNGDEEDEPKTTSDRLVKLLSMVNSDLSDADLDKVIEVLKKLHSKKKP
jgi:tetratricopeptide (TPR) repeat protein